MKQEQTFSSETQESRFAGFIYSTLQLILFFFTTITFGYFFFLSDPSPHLAQTTNLNPNVASKLEKQPRRGYIVRQDTQNSSDVSAFKLENPATIAIDGQLNEEKWGQVPQYRANYRQQDFADFENDDELDSYWQFLWDEGHIWLAVKVIDDKHVQTHDDIRASCGDSMRLYIGKVSGDNSNSLNANHQKYLLSAGDFDKIAPNIFQFFGDPYTNDFIYTPSFSATNSDDVKIAARKSADGYTLEAKIPWGAIGIVSETNLQVPFVVDVIDNDQTNMAIYGVVYSNVEERDKSNPESWGTITLKETEAEASE